MGYCKQRGRGGKALRKQSLLLQTQARRATLSVRIMRTFRNAGIPLWLAVHCGGAALQATANKACYCKRRTGEIHQRVNKARCAFFFVIAPVPASPISIGVMATMGKKYRK